MEHAYLKTELSRTLGMNTTRAKSIQAFKGGSLILTAQADNVGAFNSTLSQVVQTFKPPHEFFEDDETISVTDIATSPNGTFIAVGYSNGEIVVFTEDGEIQNRFVGHRRAITCVKFNYDSNILASGSQDNDVILWDCSGDSGICRLVGHQNAITDICFIPDTNWMISSSKDTHIRVWDIELQTCIQTVTTAASEVWSLCYIKIHNEIICAGKSKDFFVFNISKPEDVDMSNPSILTLRSNYGRGCVHRCQTIVTNEDNSLLAFGSSGKTIEIWTVHDIATIEKKQKKKRRKSKSKNQEEATTITNVVEFEPKTTFAVESKLCALTFVGDSIIASLSNNTIQKISKSADSDAYEITLSTRGHKTDIRCVSMSEDQIITAGNGEIRVWDFESGACVSHIECGYAMCLSVLAGGRFVIIGTKDGLIQFVDLSSAEVYYSVRAHSGIIWSIAVSSDFSEVATGSEDHEVRFWSFRFEDDRPILVHKRTLKLNDEVTSIAYNKDSTLIAAGLLDTTVRIFHTDTLNFHLPLYGSQLPVTSIDFSTDGALIITGSADKNIRIWGSEFGDCHRSLWAHDSPVSNVKFVPNTHLAWSTGRDGVLKLWDCDRFLCVQKLRSHISEIWGLSVSTHGQYVITGGRDKAVRIWGRTQEQLFVSQERENELARQMERDGADRIDRTVAALRGSIYGGAVEDLAVRQSVESITHGDLLCDAIVAADKQRDGIEDSPLMRDITPSEYLLRSLQRINRANLDIVMTSLPLHAAISLINWMVGWLNENKETELIVRCMCCLIKHHRVQLEASADVREMFAEAKDIVHVKIKEMRNRCGMNLAALKLISHEMKNN
ncbi:WD repeat-containing protein 3 [Histomonas meleagridis]|uniref:WD repeat-containing protein 3 n=1 Tax=Histomonas meleagridis TaxID=135588 RepID=UPI00355ABF83|nr:WD repeat-containing protein 3 [Histomonas meleagridis]KAH0806543.1 WD repeat-containing protein 3 [Histomonas meleagridis]